MAIPSFSNSGPGGPLVDALNAGNALAENFLRRKYYGPSKESEINNRNALTEGQKIQNEYMPEKLRLANALAQLQNQYYGPSKQSEIDYRAANTNRLNAMTPLQAKQLELQNEFYPELSKSKISSNKALENYRNTGGLGAGVSQKELIGFQHQLLNDHPEWSQQQINQAASAYISGENELPNGMPLPPLSGLAQHYRELIAKRETTAPLITSGVKAKQAEAELEVLNKYANEGLKPYGTTYFNKSPEQVLDTFKSDPVSQKRLGKFIASQALQYETAQNRIRLANGQPGVTSTQELMHLSRQTIDSKYPRLTQAAREEATRFLDEALKKGLEARNSVSLGASSLKNKKTPLKQPTFRYNEETGNLEEIR